MNILGVLFIDDLVSVVVQGLQDVAAYQPYTLEPSSFEQVHSTTLLRDQYQDSRSREESFVLHDHLKVYDNFSLFIDIKKPGRNKCGASNDNRRTKDMDVWI